MEFLLTDDRTRNSIWHSGFAIICKHATNRRISALTPDALKTRLLLLPGALTVFVKPAAMEPFTKANGKSYLLHNMRLCHVKCVPCSEICLHVKQDADLLSSVLTVPQATN